LERKLQKLEEVPAQSFTLPEEQQQQNLYPLPYASDDAQSHGIAPGSMSTALPTLVFDHVAPSNLLTAFEPFELIGSPNTFPESVFDFLQAAAPIESTSTEIPLGNKARNGFQTPTSPQDSEPTYSSPQPGEYERSPLPYEQEL
jgi:hypothetical protein